MTRPATLLAPFAARQNGAVTYAQARSVGLSRQQMRTLLLADWSSPVRGVFVEPTPRDPLLAGLRAALLVRPDGAACRITAARVHQLAGTVLWTPAETPELLIPPGVRQTRRDGMRTYAGLKPSQRTRKGGFAVTTLSHTMADLTLALQLDDYICALDDALHRGWVPQPTAFSQRQERIFNAAMALADGRSESPLETHLRLLLVRAGLGPEELQLRIFDVNGRLVARTDMAWPSRMLAVEADGRAPHEQPKPLFGDRRRQNRVSLAGWTVLRFMWSDVLYDSDWVVSQVRQALSMIRPPR